MAIVQGNPDAKCAGAALFALLVLVTRGQPLHEDCNGHRPKIGYQRQIELPRPGAFRLPVRRHVPWRAAIFDPQCIDDPRVHGLGGAEVLQTVTHDTLGEFLREIAFPVHLHRRFARLGCAAEREVQRLNALPRTSGTRPVRTAKDPSTSPAIDAMVCLASPRTWHCTVV